MNFWGAFLEDFAYFYSVEIVDTTIWGKKGAKMGQNRSNLKVSCSLPTVYSCYSYSRYGETMRRILVEMCDLGCVLMDLCEKV